MDTAAPSRDLPTAPLRDPVTAAVLAAEMARHPGTVRRHLNDLRAWGMAERDVHGNWWRLLFDPDVLADLHGVPHTAEQRTLRHWLERLNYWDHLAGEGKRNVGRDEHNGSVVFFDRRTGEVLWSTELQRLEEAGSEAM